MTSQEYLIVTKPSSTYRHYNKGAGVYDAKPGAISYNSTDEIPIRMIMDSLASTQHNSLETSQLPLPANVKNYDR